MVGSLATVRTHGSRELSVISVFVSIISDFRQRTAAGDECQVNQTQLPLELYKPLLNSQLQYALQVIIPIKRLLIR
jgi:hypothetical protein